MNRRLSSPGHSAFIALGANLGDPLHTLRWAVQQLRAHGTLRGVSDLYRTAPVGGPPGQPDYLNAAVHLTTALPPPQLLAELHATEARAGRERRQRWEARTLDLDLILYGDLIRTDPTEPPMLPHPRAWDRAFVLAPLHDLEPALRHPLTGQTVQDALNSIGLNGVERVDTPPTPPWWLSEVEGQPGHT